ncbi:hypothetical protein [Duganella sp. LjRoot269]|jgi:hypothetical protein|uniref:hypothetical protein n=1 Tax=Duganella sp. LjRoot269 TaxID=3342305 RepID=UPI003ECE846D
MPVIASGAEIEIQGQSLSLTNSSTTKVGAINLSGDISANIQIPVNSTKVEQLHGNTATMHNTGSVDITYTVTQ